MAVVLRKAMHLLTWALGFLALAGCLASARAPATEMQPEIEIFINQMRDRHGFAEAELERIFGMAQFQPAIINAISQPATSRSWHEFRPIFVNPKRIAGGVAFWNSHAETLERARMEFGVPEEIITAVIGVETFYGAQSGKYRVLDALTTLAFGYPKRAEFFRDELEQYLLLTREQNTDVLNVTGSYAGAIGIPQFMPSSYRRYAVDYDRDGKIDLSGSVADAIGSVANYLKNHGWETEQAIAVPALVNSEKYREALFTGNWPSYTIADLRTLGIIPQTSVPIDRPATLIELENKDGKEYWLGFNNFYVITRYNRSVNYAMSVLQLAEEIRIARNSGLPIR